MKINSSSRSTIDLPKNGVAIGAFLGVVCTMYFAIVMFGGLYVYSYTNDLKRELAEARIIALDAEIATNHNLAERLDPIQKRLGDHGKPSVGEGGGESSSNNSNLPHGDDDSFEIIQEMNHYMDRERLKKIAANHRKAYKNARPFPSHVFDGIFPDRILKKITEEHPESLLDEGGCLPGSDACLGDKFEGQHLKSSINNDKNMGIFTKIFMGYIKSSGFTHFLEELSGVDGIIPDPHYYGAGLHFTSPGGKLDIHADFNAHVSHKLERRVNILLFLNDDWLPEYGGHLELWSRDMHKCSQKVAPKLGRMTVFSTTDFSYHGHPHELTAPPGRARRSIAMYYYTPKRPKEECLNNVCSFESDFEQRHSTLFQTPKCGHCEDEGCNDLPSPNPFGD